MQKEKIALVGLVIIVMVALSVFLVALNTNIFEHLFEEQKTIHLESYADVQYIGYYENGSIFESTYTDPRNKTGGEPVQIFVTLDSSKVAASNFSDYTNDINGTFVKGFIENLVGLKAGQSKTTTLILPQDAYGVLPQIGDVINFTALAGRQFELKIVKIQENAPMPEMFLEYFQSNITTLYTMREESHYIGEVIDTYLDENWEPIWENATVVTKINETLLWKYTTPPLDKYNNLTWIDMNYDEQYELIYPTNSSRVSFINNSTILITHTPKINDTIQFYNASNPYGLQYIVDNITEKNFTGYVDDSASVENRTYRVFSRVTTLQRNETKNITEEYPEEWLEYILSVLKSYDPAVTLSLNPRASHIVYYEITVVKVY